MDFEQNEYSKYSAYKTVDIEYPYILFREPIDEISILIEGLPEGTLPVIVDIDGVYQEVARIRKSLIVIQDILRITPIIIGTETEEVLIKNIEEILERDINWT